MRPRKKLQNDQPKPMDEQEQRILIRYLADRLKRSRRELAVHQAMAEVLRERGLPDVDELLALFRNEPTLDEILNRSLAWLETLLPESEHDLHQRALAEYLRKWEPDGEPN